MPAVLTFPGLTLRTFLALLLVALAGHSAIASRQQGQIPAGTVTGEALLVYQGWQMLSDGDAAQAAKHASDILVTYPRSIAALTLLVQAEIARAGALAGLDAYERWLGSRKIEDCYVIRMVARALLRDAAASADAGARLEALKALAADGDADALGLLKQPAGAGRLPELQVLASLGEERSIRALIAQLNTGIGSRRPLIEALGRSRSRLAIPPLTKLLTDESDDLRAAAATSLGRLGAKEAIGAIIPLFAEKQPFAVRFAAAGALHRLGDAKGTDFLRQSLSSAHETVRGQAAEELAAVPEDTSWLSTAEALLGSQVPEVRLLAARLLARQDAATARVALESLLADQNPAIREAAGHALAAEVSSDVATLRRSLRGNLIGRILASNRVLELTR